MPNKAEGRKALSAEDRAEATRLRETVGRRIRMRRIALNIPITELADEVGFLYQTIQKYESGQAEPSLLTLQKLARRLKVPATFFIEDEDDPILSLTREQMALLERFEVATPNIRQAIMDLLAVVNAETVLPQGERR